MARSKPQASSHRSRTKEGDEDTSTSKVDTQATVARATALSIVDYSLILALVFGGCCANVWSYEELLNMDAQIGATLTFSQMLFITIQKLPSFLELPSTRSPVPSLKPRRVPLKSWAIQVVVLTASSLLNNMVYAYSVPLTIQIVFRSGVLAISMMFGYLFLNKRYTLSQVISVGFVTSGVILATLSRPSAVSDTKASLTHYRDYSIGIGMLIASLFLTGLLGILQERTYTKYGPHWREGVFYTHCLSLPIFLLFAPQLKQGFRNLGTSAPKPGSPASEALGDLAWTLPYLVLGANLVTQLACVSGVNQLTSHVSSVSTNLVLTTRKALSLCFSVWWFGNGWNAPLALGAGMVFLGSLLYTTVSSRVPPKPAEKPKAE